MDPVISVEVFRGAVHAALSDGGIAGVCPLGAVLGPWAAAGASVRRKEGSAAGGEQGWSPLPATKQILFAQPVRCTQPFAHAVFPHA